MRLTLLAVAAATAIGFAGPSSAIAAPVNGSMIGQNVSTKAPVVEAFCRVERWCERGRCWVHRHCW